jgi:hypothetical protein
MAHSTKDGKRQFTNRTDAMRYDKRQPGAEMKEPTNDTDNSMGDDDNNGAPEMMEDQMDSPDGNEMAAKHGPAHKVVIQHDEASGMHMVKTDHPDGHSMMTQHGSAEAAHQYGKDCAGC